MWPLHVVIVNSCHTGTNHHIVFYDKATRDVSERGNSNPRPNRYVMLDTDEVRKHTVISDLDSSPQHALMANEHAAPDPDSRAKDNVLTNDGFIADLDGAKVSIIVLGPYNPNRGRNSAPISQDQETTFERSL
jgi:hypothetical protein